MSCLSVVNRVYINKIDNNLQKMKTNHDRNPFSHQGSRIGYDVLLQDEVRVGGGAHQEAPRRSNSASSEGCF